MVSLPSIVAEDDLPLDVLDDDDDSFTDPGGLGGLETSPVEVEIDEDDNVYIQQSKATCSDDKRRYCTTNSAGVLDKFRSDNHTMCQFCVSSLKIRLK